MKNKKKIAIIGGSYLQLPAVIKAQELGYETHCFAWRDGAVCAEITDFFYPISIVEKEEILNQCRQIGIDGIVTIASDLAVLTVNYVANHMGLIANPDEYSVMTTDKYMMRKQFAASGVPSPAYVKVESNGKFDISTLNYPLIVKPTDRSGSRGVERVDSAEHLTQAVSRATEASFTHTAIIEEFVEGREVSVESISYDGQHHVLQITDKVTTEAPYFVELAHHQPSTLPEEIQQRIRTLVPQALDALHIRYGAAHSEIKITPDGLIFFIEIGARMGGDFIGSDLVQLSTGFDYLKAVILCAMGIFETPILSKSKHSGVYFLCSETSDLLPVIEHSDRYPQIVKAAITDTQLRQIQCSGDRSGYLIYQSDTPFNINTKAL